MDNVMTIKRKGIEISVAKVDAVALETCKRITKLKDFTEQERVGIQVKRLETYMQRYNLAATANNRQLTVAMLEYVEGIEKGIKQYRDLKEQ